MTQAICGVLPVAHTPFDDRDAIVWDDFQRQVDWAFEQGADGCCTGMVSEILRLSSTERAELTSQLASLCHLRGVCVASVGAESTSQAVAYAEQAEAVGCSAVMAVPPLSTKLSADQLTDYFRTVARSVGVPLIVQDASAYVGQEIPFTVYHRLLDELGAEKVLFKPEATPIGATLSALRESTGGQARCFEGSGGLLLMDSYRRGLVGTIPGMEFLPAVVALWRALRSENWQYAYRLYFPLCALVTLQVQAGLDGFLAIEKYVLQQRGLFRSARRRGPFRWSLDPETQAEVDRLLEHLGRALHETSR